MAMRKTRCFFIVFDVCFLTQNTKIKNLEKRGAFLLSFLFIIIIIVFFFFSLFLMFVF